MGGGGGERAGGLLGELLVSRRAVELLEKLPEWGRRRGRWYHNKGEGGSAEGSAAELLGELWAGGRAGGQAGRVAGWREVGVEGGIWIGSQ